MKTQEVKRRNSKFIYEDKNGEITKYKAIKLLMKGFNCSEGIAGTNLTLAEAASVRDKKKKGFNNKKGELIISIKKNYD